LLGVQEVPGSNPGGPTKSFKHLQPKRLLEIAFWSPKNGRRAPKPGGPERENKTSNTSLPGHLAAG
jgi:hypothetical protein